MACAKDSIKGVLYGIVGITVSSIFTPALIGLPFYALGGYTAGKALIRLAREKIDEEEGDMFIVFYDLEVEKSGLNIIQEALPEIPIFDAYAGASNKKIAHAKAWFTTGHNKYCTMEITFC